MTEAPRFSIVINTLNRGEVLRKNLESYRWIKYNGEFEVIVVNGPSTDNSEEVIASWLPHIRAEKCEVANLSVSRNIGICMARGDIVAFIDDDAIPEPEWLTQLAEAYADPMVGAVGGFVFNHTGYEFQYRYCLVDRFGNADLSQTESMPHLCFPKSGLIPHLLGCNSSFRRSALLEIGGFDEEYEYFLDETDVCLRIVDAGYIIVQLPNAFVHHKYAPSNIRDENKVIRNRYPIIKNKIYFTLKHARDFHSLDRVIEEQQAFIKQQKNEVSWCVDQGLLSESDLKSFCSDVDRAVEIGLRRGFEGLASEALLTEEKLRRYAGPFTAFNPIKNEGSRSIVIISRDFPPNHGGGIATFSKDLAEALAAEGNLVHVITRSLDINRVDFENGVWLHRMVICESQVELSMDAMERSIPQHIWSWSATALREAKRIATHRPIDVVEAPIWDCEGAAFLLEGEWPLVVSLQTTLHIWLQTHPEYASDEHWMATFGEPMLRLEREIMTGANAVRSISRAISAEIEGAYRFAFDPAKLFILPLGLSSAPPENKLPQKKHLEILFVGRLEARKGIDVLLQSIPDLIKQIPEAIFRIIGDSSLPGPDGMRFMDRFRSDHQGKPWLDKVRFEGRVSQEALLDAYKSCDIFLAPSRFESFGLIFLEAMREGKPVIGCSAGGIPEVVSHGVNGLLVEPGNVHQLKDAVRQLATNGSLRMQMGQKGREIFEQSFTAKRMAVESSALYGAAKSNFDIF